MSTPSISSLRSRYPEFTVALYPNATVNLAIADAVSEMDETAWGVLYERGVCALACHFMRSTSTGTFGGETGGAVKSRTVGDVSLTFATAAYETGSLGGTKYGAEYLRLRQMVGRGAVVLP